MKNTAKRLAGIIVALALALGLAACSAVRLGYANLPDLAYWWLDGYVDFSDEQELESLSLELLETGSEGPETWKLDELWGTPRGTFQTA